MCKELSTWFTLATLALTAGLLMEASPAFGESNKVEKAAAAKVSIDEAVTTARERVSGMVIEAELEQKHERLIWEVEVVTPDKKIMEIHIDAKTGAVIDVEEEKTKSGRLKRPRS